MHSELYTEISSLLSPGIVAGDKRIISQLIQSGINKENRFRRLNKRFIIIESYCSKQSHGIITSSASRIFKGNTALLLVITLSTLHMSPGECQKFQFLVVQDISIFIIILWWRRNPIFLKIIRDGKALLRSSTYRQLLY